MNDILQPNGPVDLVAIEIKKYNTAWLSKQFYIVVLFDIYNYSLN